MLEITPDLLLQAYRIGVFPMGERRDDPKLYWLDPRLRAVLPLDGFHLPQRLARTSAQRPLRGQRRHRLRRRRCAPAPSRGPAIPRAGSTSRSSTLYGELFARGHAHSVECRRDGKLVGGLYGVSVGAAFFGESMFSRERDASKVALVHLVARLIKGGFRLLDCQFMTEHLRSFGAIEMPREDFRVHAGRRGRPDRRLSARAGRRRSLRHRAGEHAHVVDAVVERRQRRRRGEHPAGEQLLLGLAGLVVDDGEIGHRLRAARPAC